MPNNPDIKFRKKIYDSLTDNVDGVITFDSESKRIYLDGDAYGNVQSDWQQMGTQQPDYVLNRTHYLNYNDTSEVDVALLSPDDVVYPEQGNAILFMFDTQSDTELYNFFQCIDNGIPIESLSEMLKGVSSMTVGGHSVFSDGVEIRKAPAFSGNIGAVDLQEGFPFGGNLKVYLEWIRDNGGGIGDLDPDDYDTGEDYFMAYGFGLMFMTDNAAYGLDGTNHPAASLILQVPTVQQLPLPYIPQLPTSKISNLNLNALDDVTVDVNTLDDGQIMQYDSSLGYWKNTNLEIGSIPEVLDDLDDVTIGTGPTDGDFLLYIGTDSQWENVTPSIVEIDETDTDIYENALQDYDGNSYPAAIIGGQVWMVGNLRTQHYMDGTALTYGDDYTTAEGSVTYPGESTDNTSEYGALYNGAAILSGGASGSKGGAKSASQTLLPEGWRIPTEDDLLQLYNAMQYEAPKSGDTKAASAYNTNELYSTRFNPQYAGYVGGVTSGSGTKKVTTGRSNAYDFGTKLWVWSSTDAGKKSDEKGGTKSGSDNLYAFSAKKYEDGGTIKGSNTALSDSKGYISMNQADKGDFLSVRGVYEGTPEEFIEEYKRAHGGGGEPTADGKFLKNLGDNQLAWSDISWNDLKERPFGEICSETSETVTLNYSAFGDGGTNPSGGVSYGGVDLPQSETVPTKAIINGTVEVELSTSESVYGNVYYLGDIYWSGSSSSTDTGEDWGLYINEDYVSVLRRLESGGTDMPTLELFYDDCTTKKLDNQYLDLADVAFSGSYSDLTGTPSLSTVAFTGSYEDLDDLPPKLVISVTYSELTSLISNNKLIPGNEYCITDYVTKSGDTNTPSAEHAFYLIVTANSENELDHRAKAAVMPFDNYFNGYELNKWQIWYDVNNDDGYYTWADTTNGKGVIYRMIDEWGNDCPYDFKNIMFLRKINTSTGKYDPTNGTLMPVYTFSLWYNGNMVDNSTKYCCSNVIQRYSGTNHATSTPNDIVFIGTECRLNTFGAECHTGTFGSECSSNTFGKNCSDLLFGDSCQGNVFDNDCDNITLKNYCISNTFGNKCSHITLDTYGTAQNNTGNAFIRNVVLEGGNEYLRVYSQGTADSSHYLQNLYVAQGLSGTSSSVQAIYAINRGSNYRKTASRDTNGNIRVYNEDDPVSIPTLATVATTGNYSDLTGTPTLSTVATTGSYSDLTGTPTIGSGVLTLEMNGTTLGTFSANDTQNKTFSLTASSSLSQLTDVTIGTLADSQTLIYDSASGKWVNEQTVRTFTFPQNGAPTQIPEAIAAFQNGSYVKFRIGTDSNEWYDMISYNAQSQSITGAAISYDSDDGLSKVEYSGKLNPAVPGTYWIGNAEFVTLDKLFDVSISAKTNGDIIRYNGSVWENVPMPSPSISSLTDVQIGTLENGQILQYDSVSGKWANVANSGGSSIVIREWTNS